MANRLFILLEIFSFVGLSLLAAKWRRGEENKPKPTTTTLSIEYQ
jgi:hypothetical protein